MYAFGADRRAGYEMRSWLRAQSQAKRAECFVRIPFTVTIVDCVGNEGHILLPKVHTYIEASYASFLLDTRVLISHGGHGPAIR